MIFLSYIIQYHVISYTYVVYVATNDLEKFIDGILFNYF